MSVIRVEKTKDYTVMSNYHLREKKMSLKAKGLLSLMLSLPQDWDYSIKGLVSICKEKELAITNTLDELKTFGYLHIEKVYPNTENNGRIEYIYTVFEFPKNENVQKCEKTNENKELQECGFQGLEIQGLDNQVQLNTYKQNTKEEYKKERKAIQPKISTYDELIDNYTINTDLKTTIIDFIKMRKLKKKPLTDRALKTMFNKLNKLAKDDELLKIQILEQSIFYCYDGVFELRKDYINQNNKQNDFEQRKNQFADIIRKNRERVE